MKSAFAKNLVRARNFMEWTQEEAAGKIGIKRPTLGSYEEGRAEPSMEILEKIVKAYAIADVHGFLFSPDFLLDGDSSQEIRKTELEVRYLRSKGNIKKAVDLLLGFS